MARLIGVLREAEELSATDLELVTQAPPEGQVLFYLFNHALRALHDRTSGQGMTTRDSMVRLTFA